MNPYITGFVYTFTQNYGHSLFILKIDQYLHIFLILVQILYHNHLVELLTDLGLLENTRIYFQNIF